MELHSAIGFGLATAPIVMTPGAGFAVFASTLATRGSRTAAFVVAGMLAGMFVLAALLVALYPTLAGTHRAVASIVGLVGGIYLIWLGLRNLTRLATSDIALDLPMVRAAGTEACGDDRSGFTEGAVTSLTNPGVFIIYLVVVPAFTPEHSSTRSHVALLVMEHLAITAVWYSALLLAFGVVSRIVSGSGWKRALVACSSVALVIIGIKSAMPAIRT